MLRPCMETAAVLVACIAGLLGGIVAAKQLQPSNVRKSDRSHSECEDAQEALRAIKALRVEWTDVLSQLDRSAKRLARYSREPIEVATAQSSESPASRPQAVTGGRRTLTLSDVTGANRRESS